MDPGLASMPAAAARLVALDDGTMGTGTVEVIPPAAACRCGPTGRGRRPGVHRAGRHRVP